MKLRLLDITQTGIVCFFLLSLPLIGEAQQLPQYTQWMTHQFSFNPAHAGIKDGVEIQSICRVQWMGIQNAPRSGFFTLSAPLQAKRKDYLFYRHGAGMKLEYDKIGPFTNTKVNFAYAGHINFSKETRLSMGMYGGFQHFGYDPSRTTTVDPDPAVFSESSWVMPDASFGAWWNGINYYFGASLQNLTRSKWKQVGLESRYRLHTYVNAGYRLTLGDNYTVFSGLLIKIPTKGPVAADVNVLFDYQNVIGAGIGYRYKDALVMGFIYFKINQQYSVQYSIDKVTSPLGKTFSHEVSFNIATFKPNITRSTKTELF